MIMSLFESEFEALLNEVEDITVIGATKSGEEAVDAVLS